MEERKVVCEDAIRNAVQSLGEGGKEISYGLIYETLGYESQEEKDVVRARINDMVHHGEIVRTQRGLFIYNFKHRPRNPRVCASIWRFVRAAKPGWTLQECSLMTQASYSYCLRYIDWLEGEGFVERAGKKEGKAVIFRNTEKARLNPETPYPPIKPTDPFEKERVAAATIARMMLCADPYALKTGKMITEACHVLLARFDKSKTRTENENGNNTEEIC